MGFFMGVGKEQHLSGEWDRKTPAWTERAQKWENSFCGRAGEALLAPVPALPSEMVASLMSLHPLWTQPAPTVGDTEKAGSCCGFLSTGNRVKLFFFTAVL